MRTTLWSSTRNTRISSTPQPHLSLAPAIPPSVSDLTGRTTTTCRDGGWRGQGTPHGQVNVNIPGLSYYNPAGHPTFVDLDGDGTKELVAEFICDAGGVSWPDVLVAYGPGWKILGSVDLGEVTPGHREHAHVTGWTTANGALSTRWVGFDGAGFNPTHWSGSLRLRGGKLALTGVTQTSVGKSTSPSKTTTTATP